MYGIQNQARMARQYSALVRLSADDPQALTWLLSVTDRLRDTRKLDQLLDVILEVAMSLTQADFGNVQLLDPSTGGLRIAAHAEFGSEFLDYFANVDDDSSACGRAAQRCAQTVIADVTADLAFEPHRDIARAAGFLAVQSTPLTDQSGRLVGMVSTHFRRRYRPPAHDLRLLELCGSVAGELAGRLGADRRRSLPEAEQESELLTTEVAVGIVHRLSFAGLRLASAQSVVGDGPGADRIAAAAAELDEAIRAVREALAGQ